MQTQMTDMYSVVTGCISISAINYNPLANTDDSLLANTDDVIHVLK